MFELKDYYGTVMMRVPTMAEAMEAAAKIPQIVDIHDNTTGNTWSRNPGGDRLNSWIWHWENW